MQCLQRQVLPAQLRPTLRLAAFLFLFVVASAPAAYFGATATPMRRAVIEAPTRSAGATRFRDLSIYDGKSAALVTFAVSLGDSNTDVHTWVGSSDDATTAPSALVTWRTR